MKDSKIFGVGCHKTGTTSLAAALTILGYRVTGPNFVREKNLREDLLSLATNLSHQHDAFQDNPWPLLYKEMDQLWPNARFILTIRNEEKWINSLVQHFGSKSTPMRELIYGEGRGSPIGDESHYLDVMRHHNEEVMNYFADRPNKLLVMDITAGDGWPNLCSFLKVDCPQKEFPKRNTAKIRNIKKKVNRARDWFRRGERAE